ncbi:hypothetical protein HaLaN_32180, partial [Haematococcus lacustris]
PNPSRTLCSCGASYVVSIQNSLWLDRGPAIPAGRPTTCVRQKFATEARGYVGLYTTLMAFQLGHKQALHRGVDFGGRKE